jgi:AbrB family looped-hinge helix DNA binding protein
MNLAKVSANGQITIPVDIRRALSLKEGDKMLFIRNQRGEIVVSNSSLVALQEAQKAFSCSDYTEDEILEAVMDLRYGDKHR